MTHINFRKLNSLLETIMTHKYLHTHTLIHTESYSLFKAFSSSIEKLSSHLLEPATALYQCNYPDISHLSDSEK